MKVGLEARWIALPTTGFGSYARNLVRHMAAGAPETEFVVYVDNPTARDAASDSANVKVRVVRGTRGVYKHIRLPLEVKRAGDLDLFHFLYNAPALFFPLHYVLTVHDMSYLHVPKMISRRDRLSITTQLRLRATRALHIITPSQNSRRDILENLRIEPDKVSVIPLATDERFHPGCDTVSRERVKTRYGLGNGYLLYVGTYRAHKNLCRLLRAYQRLPRDQKRGHPLVLAGGKGRDYRETARTITELKLEDSVRCIGFVEDSDLPAVYAMARLFVFPSLYEGFGLPLLEAMACGTPVLSSNSSCLPEVGGDTVDYFDPANVDELAEKLHRLIDDHSRLKEMAAAGIVRAAQFSWQSTAARTLEIYSRVLPGA